MRARPRTTATRVTWRLSLARERVSSVAAFGVLVTNATNATNATRVAVVAAVAVASMGACGGAPVAPSAPAPRPLVTSLDAGAASGASDALPSLDALAARGPSDAPLMREALRVDHAAPRSPDLRAERDLCVRASFAASVLVRAWFADESGAVRGEITSATSGTVPPRGPVCAKKGEALHLVIESAAASTEARPWAASARAVIFAAP
jgi:hypothetical protein